MPNKFFSKLITMIKGEEFIISPEIPFNYMFMTFVKRGLMYFRGFLLFRRLNSKIYVGKNVTIKCLSKINSNLNLSIDNGCYIDAISKQGIFFGNNVSIGKYTTIECTGSLKFIGIGLTVGDNVGLGTHGFFGCAGGVKIGNDTIFGNFVSIHSENHNFFDPKTPIRLQGVNRIGIIIGSNCWIGAKVTILDGAIIEDGAIIAAGSLLTKGTYKKDSIYGGVPAKFIKKRF